MQKLYKGTVKNGKFIPDSQSHNLAYCQHEGKRVQVTIERERKQGTARQRSYYWAVIIPIACDITGYTPDEMHQAFKWQHLRIRTEQSRLDSVRSTESLSTVEKEQYHENCRRTISQLGGYCPLPGESNVFIKL